jgi:hypothetical protein
MEIPVDDFDFISDPAHARQQGFIAQTLENIYPEAVTTNGDNGVTPLSATSTPWEVDYGRITPLIVKSVQDLSSVFTPNDLDIGATSTIATAYAGTTTPAISIDASGDVGVGSITPAARLQIAGNVLANEYDIATSSPVLGFTLGTTTTVGTIPSAALTASGSVNMYALATYNLSGLTALANAVASDEMRLTSLEARVTALENGSISTGSSSSVFSTSTLASAMSAMGAYIQDGIAQFGTLVADQFVAATNSAGTSSAGSGTVLAGNTTVIVTNAYVHPTSKIFVTFTSPVDGGWYLSNKLEGSFQLTMPAATSTDTTFDYFIVETAGQVATSTPSTNSQGLGSQPPAGQPDPTPPPGIVVPPPSTGTSTSNSQGLASQPPTVTLNGSAAMQLAQGGTFTDPGASALDSSGDDISSSIVETGSVDPSTPGSYTLTYTATDGAGNTGSASRLVSVVAPPSGN